MNLFWYKSDILKYEVKASIRKNENVKLAK